MAEPFKDVAFDFKQKTGAKKGAKKDPVVILTNSFETLVFHKLHQ